MSKTRLEELYKTKIRPELQKELGAKNVMEVPTLEKIVLNVGISGGDTKALKTAELVLAKISGQKPIQTKARKSIAGFKLREGMPIGAKVTLRRDRMYEFLDRLINIALPTVRDFQGVPTKFDGKGNYNLGIKEVIIFPEVDYDMLEKSIGMNITIDTTAKTNEHGKALLKAFGMPFKK